MFYKHSIILKLFEDFIKDLAKFIRLKYARPTMKKVLVLDNAAIHKTSAVLNTMKENFELTYFIPSYSPQYALVEHLFSTFKQNIGMRKSE